MERPSHSIRTLQFQTGSRRVTGLGLSFFVPGLFASLLMAGFVVDRLPPPPGTVMAPVKEKIDPRTPPPPEPKVATPALPTVTAPTIIIEAPPGGTPITSVVPGVRTVPVPPPPQPKPATVPDRGPVSIAATHTSPPYPPMARRLAAEGKVILRLTILSDGKVGSAEVVTSSGRRDLDEAAQNWIVRHWTYQPAIRDGAPAAAQVLAAVNFSLTNP